jgi:hypothetical protein
VSVIWHHPFAFLCRCGEKFLSGLCSAAILSCALSQDNFPAGGQRGEAGCWLAGWLAGWVTAINLPAPLTPLTSELNRHRNHPAQGVTFSAVKRVAINLKGDRYNRQTAKSARDWINKQRQSAISTFILPPSYNQQFGPAPRIRMSLETRRLPLIIRFSHRQLFSARALNVSRGS